VIVSIFKKEYNVDIKIGLLCPTEGKHKNMHGCIYAFAKIKEERRGSDGKN